MRPPVIILEFIAAACISLGVEIASAVAVVALVIVLAALADLLDWPRPR